MSEATRPDRHASASEPNWRLACRGESAGLLLVHAISGEV